VAAFFICSLIGINHAQRLEHASDERRCSRGKSRRSRKQIDAMLGWMGAMGTFMMAVMSGVLALTLIQTALLGLILWRLW
jgi:hypothetical protein